MAIQLYKSKATIILFWYVYNYSLFKSRIALTFQKCCQIKLFSVYTIGLQYWLVITDRFHNHSSFLLTIIYLQQLTYVDLYTYLIFNDFFFLKIKVWRSITRLRHDLTSNSYVTVYSLSRSLCKKKTLITTQFVLSYHFIMLSKHLQDSSMIILTFCNILYLINHYMSLNGDNHWSIFCTLFQISFCEI